MTTKRVICDTSALLASMTPVPNRGSIIWHWMETGVIQIVVSDYLVNELITQLAEPRFRLTTEQQDSIITAPRGNCSGLWGTVIASEAWQSR